MLAAMSCSPFIKVIGGLFVLKLALNVFEVSHYLWHAARREKSSGQWGYDGFISFNPYAEIVLLLALILFYAVKAQEFFSRTVLFLFVAGLAAIVLSYALSIALGRIWMKIAKKRNDEHGSR